ncbi:MAG: hypothetical protein ACRD2Z_12650 [Thermoanaerobaculia bacterium]
MRRLSFLVALLNLTTACSTPPAQGGGIGAGAGIESPPNGRSPSVDTATAVRRYARDDAGDRGLALPDDILRALQTDELVLDCPAGTRDGVSQFAPEWVAARRLDFDTDGLPDWIVNGLHECLVQPYAAYWWLYRETPAGRELLLRGAPATTFVVLASRSHGFRDLEARVVNGRGAELVESYRYDGQQDYRPMSAAPSGADP